MVKVQYKYSPNGATLYNEKHTHSAMIETHFYRLYSIMTDSKLFAGSLPHFVVVVRVLLPIYCDIGSSMPYLCIC